MPIPSNIKSEHIISAINYIDMFGVPEKRQSTKFDLLYNGKQYPPKYVIFRANIEANGFELRKFSGGEETNRFLINLGFEIKAKNEESGITTSIPLLEPVRRSREFENYAIEIRDKVIFEYLFFNRTHRWLDENIIGLNPLESRGYQSMGILHFIGLKDKHKGIFEGKRLTDSIDLLKNENGNFELLIESLERSFNDKIELNLESLVALEFNNIEINETEKEHVLKVRIGQSLFKKSLLYKQKKCSLCGIIDERFLVASHIKPWSKSNNYERLDINNGLLLCPNHDSLFDKGFISFNEVGTIVISPSLDENTKLFLNVNENIKININDHQKIYMKWHLDNIYKG